MLTLQALLLTSSLLIVVGMVASVMCLAALRGRLEAETIRVEHPDDAI